MIQPFIKFELKYLTGLINKQVYYLVTQTYARGFDHFDSDRKNILVTTYSDIGLAQIHLNAVKGDKYASIINLANEKHFDKLKEMLTAESGYGMFWSVVMDKHEFERKLKQSYKEQVKGWIAKNTTWRIGGSETIEAAWEVIFGEIFIVLQWGTDTRRFKFEEIENTSTK